VSAMRGSLEQRVASLERMQELLIEALWPGTLAEAQEEGEIEFFKSVVPLSADDSPLTQAQLDRIHQRVTDLMRQSGLRPGDPELALPQMLARITADVVIGEDDDGF
jgi:hypothetical protein